MNRCEWCKAYLPRDDEEFCDDWYEQLRKLAPKKFNPRKEEE